jgi:hypothetical protein
MSEDYSHNHSNNHSDVFDLVVTNATEQAKRKGLCPSARIVSMWMNEKRVFDVSSVKQAFSNTCTLEQMKQTILTKLTMDDEWPKVIRLEVADTDDAETYVSRSVGEGNEEPIRSPRRKRQRYLSSHISQSDYLMTAPDTSQHETLDQLLCAHVEAGGYVERYSVSLCSFAEVIAGYSHSNALFRRLHFGIPTTEASQWDYTLLAAGLRLENTSP